MVKINKERKIWGIVTASPSQCEPGAKPGLGAGALWDAGAQEGPADPCWSSGPCRSQSCSPWKPCPSLIPSSTERQSCCSPLPCWGLQPVTFWKEFITAWQILIKSSRKQVLSTFLQRRKTEILQDLKFHSSFEQLGSAMGLGFVSFLRFYSNPWIGQRLLQFVMCTDHHWGISIPILNPPAENTLEAFPRAPNEPEEMILI